MSRALGLLFLLIISIVIFLFKKIWAGVMGTQKPSLKKETQNVIQKTSKGINWLDEQWEAAKDNGNKREATKDNGNKGLGTIVECPSCKVKHKINSLKPKTIYRCGKCHSSLFQ